MPVVSLFPITHFKMPRGIGALVNYEAKMLMFYEMEGEESPEMRAVVDLTEDFQESGFDDFDMATSPLDRVAGMSRKKIQSLIDFGNPQAAELCPPVAVVALMTTDTVLASNADNVSVVPANNKVWLPVSKDLGATRGDLAHSYIVIATTLEDKD
jgi:hypothetical protein